MFNKILTVVAVILLGGILIRAEMRMDQIEEKLDDIIQTKYVVKYTPKDVECLTKNIYYEARGEDKTGKYAVAQVTLNRMKTGKWGNDVCKVVYAKNSSVGPFKRSCQNPIKNCLKNLNQLLLTY